MASLAPMKLVIGNKNYSSWSLRGWLACKQSGLAFEEIQVPLYGEDWDEQKKQMGEIAPSQGKVPILWDEDAVVWDSLAIIEYLSDKVGRDRFWPKADDARAMAGGDDRRGFVEGPPADRLPPGRRPVRTPGVHDAAASTGAGVG